jgi:hypothetical protein
MLAGFDDDDVIFEWYQKHKPDIIIAFNHSTGEALERKGVRFPQDAELMALMTEPGEKWAGFLQPFTRIAEGAVDMLVSELRDNQWGLPPLPRFTLVTPVWNPGKTFTRDSQVLKRFIEAQKPTAQAPSEGALTEKAVSG